MRVRIKRIDKTLPLPAYHTTRAAAFDIYTREAAALGPGESKFLPTNLVIELPPGHMLLIAARSSLAPKKGLVMGNGIGIIDEDFCGDEDEMRLFVKNILPTPVSVERGERLAQGIIVPVVRAEWTETDQMNSPNRGGFGSTG